MFLREILTRLSKLLPIRRNRVLFIGYYGSQYGCNPKYISQYLAEKHGDEVEIYWAFTDTSKGECIPGVKTVRFGSWNYLKILATSKVIVSNYRLTEEFHKRRSQKYIQTWHSSLRLKMIEKDVESLLPPYYIKMAKHDSAQTDFVIAGCRKSHETFKNSFWFSGTILDFGTPRNDLLINGSDNIVSETKRRLGISQDTRILLYAPTFREDKGTNLYNLDFSSICATLGKQTGEKWAVVLRLHPHLIGNDCFKGLADVVDATTYDDIQELLLSADMLVTDYSSLMFDFSITGRPTILYVPDLETYTEKERNLYFDVNELPFPKTKSREELLDALESFDLESYNDRLRDFNSKVGSFETGEASEKTSELILKLISE